MKILVIGGSYFLGRVFVMLASKEHEITVVNRGSQPLTGLPVKEIHGDRHDAGLWERCGEDYDVLVDFCAYREGDIRMVVEHLAGSVKQYIFISTVDVYAHGADKEGMSGGDRENSPGGQGLYNADRTEGRREDAPFETVRYPGEAGDYIAGKVVLEWELKAVCGRAGIRTTVLRPALIYGPLNYAPRESVFIRIMVQNRILPVITGADGRFQFLYVKDGAEAVMKCLLNEAAYGQSYNLCGDEIVDYRRFARVLKRADEEVQELELSAKQAQAQGFPLPFAVQESETHLCCNEKSKRELGMVYTPLEEGMEKTYRAFYNIFKEM